MRDAELDNLILALDVVICNQLRKPHSDNFFSIIQGIAQLRRERDELKAMETRLDEMINKVLYGETKDLREHEIKMAIRSAVEYIKAGSDE